MSFFWAFFKVINKKLFYKKEHDWIEKNVDILFCISQNERIKFIFHWVTLEDSLYWLLYWAIHLMEIL